jgi:hypothetical protein
MVADMNVAICATKNRPRYLPLAILSFFRQTIPDKRLIIFENGRENSELFVQATLKCLEQVVPLTGDVDYCYEARDTQGRLYIHGTAINRVCSLAQPDDILYMWDDDDWSAPERMESQRVLLNGYSLVGYDQLLFYHEERKCGFRYQFAGPGPYAIGTSQCFPFNFWQQVQYPELVAGADTKFCNIAREARQMCSIPAVGMMVARAHRDSTCTPRFGGGSFKPFPLDEFPPQFALDRQLIEELLPK